LVSAIAIFISVLSRVSYKINPDSAIGRLFIWKISAQMITDHPTFGIGYGRYGVEYLTYQAQFFDCPEHAQYYDWADNLKGAKNEYIQLMAETGILRGVIALLILIAIYAICLKMMKITAGNIMDNWKILMVMISMNVILFHGLVDNPFYDVSTALIFWFDIGIISLAAKEKGILLLTHNSRRRSIEFRHHFILRFVGVGLLLYNSFHVLQKGQGYIHWQHGQNLVAIGQWGQGIAEYEQARMAFSNDGELQFHLGATYAYTKQPQNAAPLLEASCQRFNDKNLYIVKGYALIQLNHYQEAENSFQTALQMYPKLLLPRLWLAELYQQQERSGEAIAELHQILVIQPKIVTEESERIKSEASAKLSRLENMKRFQ
jgi:O-antigen polymerase